jgi:hypothetical protein
LGEDTGQLIRAAIELAPAERLLAAVLGHEDDGGAVAPRLGHLTQPGPIGDAHFSGHRIL